MKRKTLGTLVAVAIFAALPLAAETRPASQDVPVPGTPLIIAKRKAPKPAAHTAAVSHLPKTAGTADWGPVAYAYDLTGQITAIGGNTYGYNGVGRLTTSTTNGVSENHTYDRYGNLLTLTQPAYTLTFGVDPNNNRLGQPNRGGNIVATYDSYGNLTNDGSYGYSYDSLNMMTNVTTNATPQTILATYLYDADDERVATVIGTTYRYTLRGVDQEVLREVTYTGSAWTWSKDYVYRGSTLLAEVTPAGTVHYHVDHLGSPRMISDESSPALRVAIHDYFPFGADTANITQDSRRLRFTGHERDLDGTGPGGTSLDYMHARYYTAAWARFLSVDSVSGNPGTPQTWNRYAYVADNPLNGIDPRGLSCQDVFYDGAVCWSDLVVLKGGITARKELDFAGIHFSAGPAISVDALTGDVSGSISTSGGPPSSEDGGRSGSFGVTVTAKNSENYDPKVTVTGSFAANGLGTSGSISSASRSINGSVGGVGPTVSTPSTSPNQPGAVDPASSGISMAVAGVGAKLTASEVSVSIPIDLYGTITIGFRPSGLFQALQDRYDATIEHFNQLVAAQQGH